MNSDALTHPRYRADIDGMRAIAVLSVVGYHAVPGWVRGGFVGVDVFFVISGFLISSIIFENLRRGTFSFPGFYARRIRRIFPALALVLAATILFGRYALLADEYKQLGKHVAAGAGFVSNFILWQESGYFDKDAVTKPLLHLWSLGIEEQFYLIWPALLWLAWRSGLNLLFVVLAISIASFAVNAGATGHDPAQAFYSPVARFWELMLGSALAHVALPREPSSAFDGHSRIAGIVRAVGDAAGRRSVSRIPGAGALTGLALILGAVALLTRSTAYPGWWALAPTAGACLLIAAGPDTWINRRVLACPVLVWFGLISYPLYLWHWPLLSFAQIIESGVPAPMTRAALVAAAVVLAWLTYVAVERPVRRTTRRAAAVTSLSLAVCAIAAAGLHAYTMTIGSAEIAKMQVERQAAIRSPYCHFNEPKQTFEEYQKGMGRCLKMSGSKRNVLIVGDSTAADMYAAFRSAYDDVNFLQATGGGCTPIHALYVSGRLTPQCDQMVDYALAFAVDRRVDAVILAARWPRDYFQLEDEIARLRSAGIATAVVGPPLQFSAEVTAIVARKRGPKPAVRPRVDDDGEREAGNDARPVSDYISRTIVPEWFQLSRDMDAWAAARGARYIDRLRIYCGSDCPILNDDGELMIIDKFHLTVAGQRYLGGQMRAHRVMERILGAAGAR